MPDKARCLDAAVESYLEKVGKNRPEETVKKYRWLIGRANRTLKEGGYAVHPTKWTEDTVMYLRETWQEDGKRTAVIRREFCTLSNYLVSHHNSVMKEMHMEWPQDDRIHVDWLTPEQALRTMDAASGMERIIMHLELNLGMRRVEVIRQRVQDISLGYINVHGKGRQGGKWRTVPFHPDTNAELGYWFKLRE